MPSPKYNLIKCDFKGPLELYPTVHALFGFDPDATREFPPGCYHIADHGRELSGHHDGFSDGYYYRLANEAGPCGWHWQSYLDIFELPEEDRSEGFDPDVPVMEEIESQFQLGAELAIPVSFISWDNLYDAQWEDKELFCTSTAGRYRVEDVGVFCSQGEMAFDGDLDLTKLDDLGDYEELRFYLLRNLADGRERWTYEFLLERAMNGASAEHVLAEFDKLY